MDGDRNAEDADEATLLDATVVDATAADPTVFDAQTGRLAAGTRFAGYVIEGVAGQGGMGVVYRARQLRPSRLVALKVISPALAGDSEFRDRFAHESELAASIEHSNVIPVYEVGEESCLLYIVMRYVEGTDLRAMLAARDAWPQGARWESLWSSPRPWMRRMRTAWSTVT